MFKFVFRVNWSWLEISYHSGMLCVSPLPNSYWLVYPGMKKNVLYVAHDLFKASANTKKTDRN